MFESKQNMIKIVNESYYFNRMSKYDLLARNVASIDSYKKLYIDSILEFTPKEKELLEQYVAKISKICYKFTVLLSIPWKFCKVKQDIEQGWPHTLADVIVLNSQVLQKEDLLKTLIHEKIHVYQRLYPLETHILITEYWGFQIFDTFNNTPKIRNNPDINNFVYGTKKPAYKAYNTENPSSLEQTHLVNSTLTEHPYELMAYLIPSVLSTSTTTDFYIKALISWLRRGFI